MKAARFLTFTALFALIFSFCATTFAQSSPPGYATVVRMAGEARYSLDNGASWRPLVIGQTLVAGALIQTAIDGSVDFVLGSKSAVRLISRPDLVAPATDASVRGMTSYQSAAEQNIIHMNPGTVLAIDKLTIGNTGVDAVSDTELDLRDGTILGSVKKLSASSQYLIKVPNGIAGVRGTRYVISVTPGSVGDIIVLSGGLVVSYKDKQGQVVVKVLGPGEEFNPLTGDISRVPLGLVLFYDLFFRQVTTLYTGQETSVEDDHTIIHISATTGLQQR